MPPPKPSSSSSSVRVLVRPPTTITPTTTSSSSTATSTSPLDGVVVVGFLGTTPTTDVSHLINRILDKSIFGSANLDKKLFPPGFGDEWFRHRRISYHCDEEKGLVFLQFFSGLSPLEVVMSSRDASGLEKCEADDLRGMLFMFSVCHIIIIVHEGLRFDTQLLKKFRILQNAKHALSPFIRSKLLPTFATNLSSPSLPSMARASVSPPSRRGGATHRHGSAISLMSGSGPHSSVLPGQCTPVILFVFTDDLLDGTNPSSSPDESADVPSLTQPNSLGGLSRSAAKSSGPVVVLTRPASRNEGGFRKKLHSSLDAQIRFLIKKCRILVSLEASSLGSRGTASVNTLPLFLLDSSKLVALVDRSMIQRGESLEFVTSIIEEAWNSKQVLDVFSFDKFCQNLNNEDIQVVKDFIFKQVDILRGQGALPGNSSSGSVAGVGMVAAAAAAAAASAAAGKQVTAPELPSLEKWLSLSNLILESLLSVRESNLNEAGHLKKSSAEEHVVNSHEEHLSIEGIRATEAAISYLECTKGLNMKFSVSWCQRALPAAKEVYLNDLPEFYPTVLHKRHLENALHAFKSMVKGPAVQKFSERLVEECETIWKSGRQLCDAVSLTGKPCMYQRHDGNLGSNSTTGAKQHSSGYVFLHACACGRSRRLRDDPFDFESANITFSCFSNCDDSLPTFTLPKQSNVPLPLNSWRLTRIAGAGYYSPLKGMLQTGFISKEKYLFEWIISRVNQKDVTGLQVAVSGKSSVTSLTSESVVSTEEVKNPGTSQFERDGRSPSNKMSRNKQEAVDVKPPGISFGRGLPAFPMKPFSEVVAGTGSTNQPLPNVQQRKQSKAIRDDKEARLVGQTFYQESTTANHQRPQTVAHASFHDNSSKLVANKQTDGNPFLQIGSNLVPVNVDAEKNRSKTSLKEVLVYIGFEHECPYGHRFLLSSEHLQELDPSYSLSDTLSSTELSTNPESRNSLHEKVPRSSHKQTVIVANGMKKGNRSAGMAAKLNEQQARFTPLPGSDMKRPKENGDSPMPADYKEKLVSGAILEDGGSASSLLSRKLPIYMNCPHCRKLTRKDHQKAKCASTVSQLQRIFFVTPRFPTVLETCPVVQFEESCLPSSVQNREQQSRFSLSCQVILPPESFLTLRLPFVYGVQMDDGSLHPLNHLEHQPELTAWLVEGTTLRIISSGLEYEHKV